MSGEHYYGVFCSVQGAWTYLVDVRDDEDSAREEASRRDELAFERAQEEGEDPNWDDYDRLHHVEPVSTELVESASIELERGFAVLVS